MKQVAANFNPNLHLLGRVRSEFPQLQARPSRAYKHERAYRGLWAQIPRASILRVPRPSLACDDTCGVCVCSASASPEAQTSVVAGCLSAVSATTSGALWCLAVEHCSLLTAHWLAHCLDLSQECVLSARPLPGIRQVHASLLVTARCEVSLESLILISLFHGIRDRRCSSASVQ